MNTPLETSKEIQNNRVQSGRLMQALRPHGLQLGILAVGVIIWLLFVISSPQTWMSPNIYVALMTTVPFFALVAIPLTLVVITGEIDLSFPAIMAFMAIGVYSVNNLDLDVYMAIFFGILGYIFMKLSCQPAPLILAFVLGPLMEENLRRALLISRGDPTVFITRPISAAFLIATFLLLAIMIVPAIRKKREEAVSEAAVL